MKILSVLNLSCDSYFGFIIRPTLSTSNPDNVREKLSFLIPLYHRQLLSFEDARLSREECVGQKLLYRVPATYDDDTFISPYDAGYGVKREVKLKLQREVTHNVLA